MRWYLLGRFEGLRMLKKRKWSGDHENLSWGLPPL
jgi:hypothetical protein